MAAADRPAGISESFGTLRYGKLLELLMYDCRRYMTLTGSGATFVPPAVEQWLKDRMAGSDATHVVNMPSTPPGWSAGKWGEWYSDMDDGKEGLTTKIPKAYWQSGWRLQHDRLLRAASEMRGRIPLFVSGDLHALGEARILETSGIDLAIEPGHHRAARPGWNWTAGMAIPRARPPRTSSRRPGSGGRTAYAGGERVHDCRLHTGARDVALLSLDARAAGGRVGYARAISRDEPGRARVNCMNRRSLFAIGAKAAAAAVLCPRVLEAAPKLRVTTLELLAMRATERTVWLFVRLGTDAGLTGLGEASDAFGFANTSQKNAAQMEAELRTFFGLVQGKSPLEVAAYRRDGERLATGRGLIPATAYSAIEQALWDLSGKALDVPTYSLLGGKLRDSLPVYANVNRATRPRTPEGFAATALRAVKEGFRAVKAAPWDGFPPPTSPAAAIDAAVETGIASVVAMREAIGPDVELMVDCHSFFDVPLAERVALRLEPQKLSWYEEPVPPERVEETLEIRKRIPQPMAGGEDPVRRGRLRAPLPHACRARDHARRQTLWRPARADAYRRDG